MRPVSVSKSASSHAGIAETVSVAPRASDSTGLLVRSATTWPSSTRKEGMVTRRPFTSTWRCVTNWRACARVDASPSR